MRTLIIGILVLFLITLGCVNSTPNTATADAATNETTPTTSIPNETINPETSENTLPSENNTPPVETTPVETTPTPTAPETYTLTDVAAHNKTSDCRTAIQGKVYDITTYLSKHPGGPAISQACGKDGTTLFTTRNGSGPHPANATKTLEKYYLGELKN